MARFVRVRAHLFRRCQAGGASRSASSHRGCTSEDMLLETEEALEAAPERERERERGAAGARRSVRPCARREEEEEEERERQREREAEESPY